MTKVSELVSQNVANAITNYNTWGNIIINVKSYGAKGDGITNDTASVNTLFAAVPPGAAVIFPSGTYILNNVSVTKPVKIFADGKVTITRNSANPCFNIAVTGDIEISGITIDGASYVSSGITAVVSGVSYLHDLTVQYCGVPGYAAGHNNSIDGLRFTGCGTVKAVNCTFDTCERDGLFMYASYAYVSGCKFYNCGRMGISNDPSGTTYPLEVSIVNNYIINCGSGGIGCESSLAAGVLLDATYINNRIYNCGNDNWGYGWGITAGIYSTGIMQGNIIKNFNMTNKVSTLYAIVINSNVGAWKIDNNEIYSCGGSGIYSSINPATSLPITISNNTVYDAWGSYGIFVYQNNYAIVNGNYVSNCRQEGIRIRSCTAPEINSNTLVSNSKASSGTYSAMAIYDTIFANVNSNTISGTGHKYGIEVDELYWASITMNSNSINNITVSRYNIGGANVIDVSIVNGNKIVKSTNGALGTPYNGKWLVGDQVLNLTSISAGYIGKVCISGNYFAPTWAISTVYALGDRRYNDTAKVYECITAGTSAGAGGPTGTAADITDGTVHWKYIGVLAVFNNFGLIT